MSSPLPVEAVRGELLGALDRGPVVLAAATGSGKSTQVPRWCGAQGPTLVIEPRRVACRSLARYVSELEGTGLGEAVGYVHRHESRRGPDTRVLYVTPGVALRLVSTGELAAFESVVLDEFHERTMELDLLLALLAADPERRLVVMSATLEADRLERFLGGTRIEAPGRVHPVEVGYTDCSLLPGDRQLARRVRCAVLLALDHPGDVLVFLPGVREIQEAQAACRSLPGVECLPLHGGLPSKEQDRAFHPGPRRRVILSTNVAETSVTLPRIGVVVDSGLVRRTLYRWGAASLGLVPVARDSAEQRRGRAGRLGPGVCLRMWSEAALLEAHTPPEIHREPLEDLVLRAGECGHRLADLRMLDPPQPYALEHALGELVHLRAATPGGEVTDLGRRLARHPMSPFLAAVLEACRDTPQAQDAVDLVAALAGPPWRVPPSLREDLDADPCDANLRILAMRRPEEAFPGGPPGSFQEARRIARQLRSAWKLPSPDAERPVDRLALARRVLAAHPRMGFVRRTSGKGLAFGNGGSEILPDRGSALEEDAQAMVVLALRAREGRRGTELLATCCLPVPLGLLAEEGLGRRRLARVERKHGELEAVWETVHAGRVLCKEAGVPRGEVLLEAVADLCLRGKLFAGVREPLPDRLAALSLSRSLAGEARAPELDSPESWLLHRLRELGVASTEDLELLEDDDLLPPLLPPHEQAELDRHYPRRLTLPDGIFSVVYTPSERRVVLIPPRGVNRRPRRRDLPRWEHWKIFCRIKNRETQVLT